MWKLKDLLRASAVGVVLWPGVAGAAEIEIGDVILREYWGAEGALAGGGRERLYFNTDVYADETVETGRGGGTALRFLDGTRLQVGGSSKVVLDEFVYDPSTGDGQAVFNLGKGIFRFVSGNMNKEGYVLRTPTATLTVRGTDAIINVGDDDKVQVTEIEGGIGCADEVGSNCADVEIGTARNAPPDPFVDADIGPGPGSGPGGDAELPEGGGGGPEGGEGNG